MAFAEDLSHKLRTRDVQRLFADAEVAWIGHEAEAVRLRAGGIALAGALPDRIPNADIREPAFSTLLRHPRLLGHVREAFGEDVVLLASMLSFGVAAVPESAFADTFFAIVDLGPWGDTAGREDITQRGDVLFGHSVAAEDLPKGRLLLAAAYVPVNELRASGSWDRASLDTASAVNDDALWPTPHFCAG